MVEDDRRSNGGGGTAEFRGSVLSLEAPGKLNLSLRITGRRSDGYHLLRSEFVCVGIYDSLRIWIRPAAAASAKLTATGFSVPAEGENLALRAAIKFLEHTGVLAQVEIQVVKRIPIGAGMGGGSSDAAAVLRGLSRATRPVMDSELHRLALDLGADVPFFLKGQPALVEGIGEILEPLAGWPEGSLVVAYGGVPLSTREVFRQFDTSLTSGGRVSSIRASAEGRGGAATAPANDLEAAAILIEPCVGKLKDALLARGGAAVSMTGSGSAVFGFWPNTEAAQRVAENMRASGWWAEATEIIDRVPEVEFEDEGDDGR